MPNWDVFRIGVVGWTSNDGVASMLVDGLQGLGCRKVTPFLYDAKLPSDIDIVLVHGPLGSLVPLIHQLLDLPPCRRPVLALWMTEQLPNPALPEWFRFSVGAVRSRLERLAFQPSPHQGWRPSPYLRWVTKTMHRFRYYGDLFWLAQQDFPFVLAVGSRWICGYLRARGFDPIEAYFGYHRGWGADLKLERDIPVLWIGKVATTRRRRILREIHAGLKKRGLDLYMVDGVKNPYLFGDERTILLNRTQIVLNVLREKWDNNAFRYYLSASNRALIVTEPTLPHTPFIPGVHLVEAPVSQIVDTICYYLTHHDERAHIVEQAYQLVTDNLTLETALRRILERATSVSGIRSLPERIQ